MSTGPPAGFTRVFNAEQVPLNGNRCVMVEGRGIVIYRRAPRRDSLPTSDHVYKWSAFYAMDAVCYHMGGPMKEVMLFSDCMMFIANPCRLRSRISVGAMRLFALGTVTESLWIRERDFINPP